MPFLKDSPLAAMEFDKQGKALTWYIDLNTNGKLDAEEQILAAAKKTPETVPENTRRFLTPDFEIHHDGRTVPYRLGVVSWTSKDYIQVPNLKIMCAMEGTANIAGEDCRLTIYDAKLGEGNYTKYSQCQVVLSKSTSDK
jgi:hypothetical protein